MTEQFTESRKILSKHYKKSGDDIAMVLIEYADKFENDIVDYARVLTSDEFKPIGSIGKKRFRKILSRKWRGKEEDNKKLRRRF